MADPTFTLAGGGEWDAELGAILSEEEAVKVLMERAKAIEGDTKAAIQRMGREEGRRGEAVNAGFNAAEDLFRSIIRMLPEEARTASVLATMDLRQVLAPLMSAREDAAERSVNGQKLDSRMQYVAGLLYSGVQETALADLTQAYLDTGKATDEDDARKQAEQQLSRRRLAPPGQLLQIEMPTAETASINTQTGARTPTTADPDDPMAWMQQILQGGGVGGPTEAFMTRGDMDLLFRDEEPTYAFGRYMQELDQRAAARSQGALNVPEDSTRVRMEGESQGAYMRPGASIDERGQARRDQGDFTLTEMKGQLQDMTRKEVTAITEKLMAAGIFDEIGQPDGPTIIGDPTDVAMRKAWTYAIGKAYSLKKPLMQVLAEGAAAKEESDELRDKKGAVITFTDPAALRLAADQIGKAEIGRGLSRAEKVKLIQFVHGLERREGEETSAIENNPEEGGERTAIDWQAQMTEYIQSQNPAEAAAKDANAQYNDFLGMLGPGGGLIPGA